MVEKGDLFNPKTIERLCLDVTITPKQKQASKEWLTLLDTHKLEDEKSNYPKFMQIILQDILGYPIKEIDFENDNVEFQFSNSNGKRILCFEAKGTATKDLLAPQHRTKKEHETPIKQTWDYMGSIGLDYGICTNYKDFFLITKQLGYSKLHKFDFNSIKKNDEKLKEFVGIFSKERIIEKGFVEKLYKESVVEEHEFTKEFYKLFHETRLMMIKAFQENDDVLKDDAIHHTQLYLNRLIFMFFAEDHDFLEDKLFTKRVTEVLNSPLISEHSKMVSDEILGLFQAMDKGSHRLGIFGFNGGLFQEQIPPTIYFSDLKDSKFFIKERQNSKLKIKPSQDTQKIINKYQNELNPIIVNLLMLDSFDFRTEVNVNILGHIFEQSISDLEELKQEDVSRRKKEGIFYTPEYITDYICRNTIIPYLSKSGSNSVHQLINEYKDNIEELEKKFKEIKILDPACGSGAFLVKTVDVLLEIHKEIQLIKESSGKYSTGNQFQLTKWNEETEARMFVENNIYGVDINSESIEITKLSLFLKIASKNRKLIGLEKRIKIGNSLINDKSVDMKSFDWNKEFSEVLDPLIPDKGFDVVLGNPPYVRQELIKKYQNYLKDNFKAFSGKADLFVYFYEKAVSLLKNDGCIGFISSGKFLEAGYGRQLNDYLFSTITINKIISFGDLEVFEGVTAYPIIFIAKNSIPNDYDFSYYRIDKLDFVDFPTKIKSLKPQIINNNDFRKNDYKIVTKNIASFLEKISRNSRTLKEICGLPLVGIKTGYNTAYFTENNNSVLIKTYVLGRDIKKYAPIIPKTKIIFPYVFEKAFFELIDIKKFPEIQSLLEPHRKKLENRAIIKDGIKKKTKQWFEYQQINKTLNLKNEYIINPDVSLGNNFTLSRDNVIDMTGFIIPTNDRYILAILNSNIVNFIMKLWASTIRGGYLRYKVQYLEKIPIKDTSDEKKKIIIDHVNEIMDIQKELYSIKDKFMTRVLSTFNLSKTNTVLDNFFYIGFY